MSFTPLSSGLRNADYLAMGIINIQEQTNCFSVLHSIHLFVVYGVLCRNKWKKMKSRFRKNDNIRPYVHFEIPHELQYMIQRTLYSTVLEWLHLFKMWHRTHFHCGIRKKFEVKNGSNTWVRRFTFKWTHVMTPNGIPNSGQTI